MFLELLNAVSITSTQIDCIPGFVSQKLATLSVQFSVDVAVTKGSFLQVTVPKQTSVARGNIQCAIAGFSNNDGLKCTGIDSQTLEFPINQDLKPNQQNQFTFQNAFNAPITSEISSFFIIEILGGDRKSIVRNEQVSLTTLQPAQLASATVSQEGSAAVGDQARIFFSVIPANPIPAGGGLFISWPKWNTLAPIDKLASYIVQPQCASKVGTDAAIKCTFYKDTTPGTSDTLVVENAFPNGAEAGKAFQFYVNLVRNPISMSPVTLTVTTCYGIQTGLYNFLTRGLVDQGPASFVANTPALMDPTNSKIFGDDQTVSGMTNINIPFSIPVPVQQGCQILITLPRDFQVLSGQLKTSRGWGIFGGVQELLVYTNEKDNTIKIVDQCQQYSPAGFTSSIKIGPLQNPRLVKTTDSFKIEIFDSNQKAIASILTGVNYTPTPGTFQQIRIVPYSNTISVQEYTNVDLYFAPDHMLLNTGQIQIKMPDDLPLIDSCSIIATSGMSQNLGCQFNQGEGSILLTTPFQQTSYSANGQPLKITFKDLRLPDSERLIKGISMYSQDIDGAGKYFIVDYYSKPDIPFFTPNPITFLESSVSTQQKLTYTSTKFTVKTTLASDVPKGSYIKVVIPPQVIMKDESSFKFSCEATGSRTTISQDCSLTKQVSNQNLPDFIQNTYTIRVDNAFSNAFLGKEKPVTFTFSSMYTPISMETSDSFQFYIYDKNDKLVNFENNTLTLTNQDAIKMPPIQVQSDSLVVGDQTNHLLTFKTPVPILQGFRLEILVPLTIGTPKASDIQCQGIAPLVQNLNCQLNGNRINLQLKMTDSSPYFFIKSDTALQINIGKLTNPGSFRPTDSYQLIIIADDWYYVAKSDKQDGGGQVSMTQTRAITSYNFDVFDKRQNALTTVTIGWTSTQPYPAGTTVEIQYNDQQFVAVDPSNVQCLFRQSRQVDCTLSKNKITVSGSNFMPSKEYGSQAMSLTITNLKINVQTPMTTDSMMLTTFEPGKYAIDSINQGMTLTFLCNYPCQTCRPGQPSICTSCNNVIKAVNGSQEFILYEGTCYQKCPAGTFQEYFSCKPCDKKCKTCEEKSGTSCTSCNNNPGSLYPYLNGKNCSSNCNYDYYGNIKTGMCEKCSSPCRTCVETPNKCTSCDSSLMEKYFTRNECKLECPIGQYIQVEAYNQICYDCNQNCERCEHTADNCISCPKGWLLSHLNNKCVKQCPPDLTIFTPATPKQPYDSCEPCKSSCKTCSGSIDQCTSCASPLSLKRSEQKCVLVCDAKNNELVSLNRVCQGCSSSCKTCQGTPDYCLTCVNGTYFYKNHCVQQCPLIGDYQFEPDENGICVIKGLVCPFGFKVNYTGDGCELKNQICEENYELNFNKTACVPVSNFYVPFPIIIVTIIISIAPIVSYIKFRQSLIIANLIAFIAFMESICIIVLVAQARRYGIISTFYLAVVGLIFQFASNMFFMLMYIQQVQLDSAFKHWQPKHNKITIMIQTFGVFNFKMFRFLYSKLFGRIEFDAPFTDPTVFYRPFNLTSLFALLTVSLPLIVSSIIGLIYVRWGYQLYITCIEMLILTITLLILQVTEYCTQKFSNKKYYKVTKKQVESKVCSEFPDSDENDEYGTVKDKSKSRPKSIKAVRHLNNVVARMAGHDDFVADQQREVEQEIEELHNEDMMHRQLRHCQSFKIFRPSLEEAFSGSEDEHDRFQDFISEPSSPRSKEMLFNRKFVGRMHQLHDVYQMRDQFDNCYHEAVNQLPNILLNPVDKRVQTNVLELLGIDDARIANQSQQQKELSDMDMDDHRGRKKGRKRLSKKRIMEIPAYEPEDISGDFDADETGKYLLIQKQGRLHDKKGRLVNRRGYLIDQIGNVINKLGKVFFFVDELNPEDDEIPEPFCFDRLKSLKSKNQEIQFRVALHSQVIEDKAKAQAQSMLLEQQFQEAQQKKLSDKVTSKMNSEDSSSVRDESHGIEQVREEEELFIQKLTQLKQPKSKNQLLSAQSRKPGATQKKTTVYKSQKITESQPIFKAMRPPSQTSVHRVEQLQEMIQMKDLSFSGIQEVGRRQGQPSNNSRIAKYVPGQDLSAVYQQNQAKLKDQHQKVQLDQDFLQKMENFNKQLNSKRKEFLNNSQGGKYLNSDGQSNQNSVMEQSIGLAHRNLSSVYGRVKQKFNQNMGLIIQKDNLAIGPSATINKRVDSRLHELEEIYMHPRIDGKEIRSNMKGPVLVESQDVTKQLREIHHIKSQNQSVFQSQFSAGEIKSQTLNKERRNM